MEEAANVTVTDPTQWVMGFTLITMAVLMTVESIVPRRKLSAVMGLRWLNNLSLSVVTYFVSTLASNGLILLVVWWTDLNDYGLLQRTGVGLVPSFVIVLLVAQFLSYWVHRIYHSVPLFWRIHAIHHNDIDVDVTTGYRHHPLESIIPLPIMIPVFMLLGAPIEAALMYQFFHIAISLFSHSNIRLPASLDRILRQFILTPDFHRNHHCSERLFTDSNYGSLVPRFDYLFGTATDRPFDEQESMELGLDYLRDARDSRIDQLLALPFKKWPR